MMSDYWDELFDATNTFPWDPTLVYFRFRHWKSQNLSIVSCGLATSGFYMDHCKWKKMDDMKVMFVFIRVMLADVSYVPVNESYHYKMAFGLCAWKQT